MIKTPYIILTTLLLGACAAQQEHKSYFPPAVFDSRPDKNAFFEMWYSGHLRALEEEPLPQKSRDKKKEIYRFTCLRTFHNPFSIRVDVIEGGKDILIRKVTSGQGGYDSGTLKETQSIVLSRKASETLREVIDKIGFWDLPTTKRVVGVDGSQWIVEAVRNGRYHVVDRFTPRPGTDIRTLGESFLSLAGWHPDNLY